MNTGKKILLISVSTGSGHVRAAEALRKEAQQKFPELQVEHIDMMDYVSKPLRKTIVDSYNIMAKKLPELWGFFYKKTDSPKISQYTHKISSIFNQFNSGKFFKYIKDFNPDHILCTIFLPIYALNPVLKKNNIHAKISLVMTDYYSHDLQISPNISHYFVPTEKIRWRLTCNNIPEKNITVSGIPIDPIFYEPKLLESLKEKYNIQPEQETLLVLSGGKGLADANKIISTLFKSKKNLNILAITGNSPKLKQQLEKLNTPKNINLNIIGWTDKIDEYMRVADIIITKPGGLTTTECITLKKPIIAVSPIPGQEEHNTEYILENNLGVVARTSSDLLYYIEKNTSWRKKLNLQPTTYNLQPNLIPAQIILKQLAK